MSNSKNQRREPQIPTSRDVETRVAQPAGLPSSSAVPRVSRVCADLPSLAFLQEFECTVEQDGWRDIDAFLGACEPALRRELLNHDITLDHGYVRVSGGVSLWRKPIKELPCSLWIERNLDLEGTRIDRLPPNLHVGQDLNLGAMARHLSPDLFVGGDLNLMYSKVHALHPNTIVMGDLCVELSPLSETSDKDIRANAKIYGSIHR
jgi:hypothetical protein